MIKKEVSKLQITSTTRAMLVLLALLCSWLPVRVQAAERVQEPAGHVLLVYDSLAIGTPLNGNIETLRRLLSAAGMKVTLQSEDGYYTGQIDSFPAVVQIRNQPVLPASASLSGDLMGYEGYYLHVGAGLPERTRTALKLDTKTLNEFSLTQGKLAYAPSFGIGPEDEREMAALLAKWLGLAQEQALYLLIKEVYPFSDLTELISLSDQLYNAGIPFMLAVRPVFANLQSPAMKRYTDAIRYAQSRGASILVQAPVVASTISSGEDQLREKLSLFIDLLASSGIAPLGVVSELYWSYDRIYSEEGLSIFDSAVLLPDEKRMYREQTSVSMPFASSLFVLNEGENSAFDLAGTTEPLMLPAAQVFDMPDSLEGVEALLQHIIEHWGQYADYRYQEHRTTTVGYTIESAAGVLMINGKPIGLDMNEPSMELDEADGVSKEQKPLSLENNILIAIIIVSLLIFSYFIYLGYGIYRRKYYK